MINKKEFLITRETTYNEIAEYLYKHDPNGIDDLVYKIILMKPSLNKELEMKYKSPGLYPKPEKEHIKRSKYLY